MKIVSRNMAHLDRLLQPNLSMSNTCRRDAVIEEIRTLEADTLCILEGTEPSARFRRTCSAANTLRSKRLTGTMQNQRPSSGIDDRIHSLTRDEKPF
jgi:hypothetical protein